MVAKINPATSSPYLFTDYPPKYMAAMVKEHGDETRALYMVNDFFELEPDDCPDNLIELQAGETLLFEKGKREEVNRGTYIGKAYNQIAFDDQGEAYFETQSGPDYLRVAEIINYCRRMFKEQFTVQAWPCYDEHEGGLAYWFLEIYDTADAAALKLQYGGSL